MATDLQSLSNLRNPISLGFRTWIHQDDWPFTCVNMATATLTDLKSCFRLRSPIAALFACCSRTKLYKCEITSSYETLAIAFPPEIKENCALKKPFKNYNGSAMLYRGFRNSNPDVHEVCGQCTSTQTMGDIAFPRNSTFRPHFFTRMASTGLVSSPR